MCVRVVYKQPTQGTSTKDIEIIFNCLIIYNYNNKKVNYVAPKSPKRHDPRQ